MATVSPSLIASPTWHSIFHTVPVMWASMSGTLPPDVGLGTRAGTIAAPMDVPAIVVIVAAHKRADRIEQTPAALGEAFPPARVPAADDASTDDTAARAAAAGAEVVTAPRNI